MVGVWWIVAGVVALWMAAALGWLDWTLTAVAFVLGPERYERLTDRTGQFRAWASRRERHVEDRVVSWWRAIRDLILRKT